MRLRVSWTRPGGTGTAAALAHDPLTDAVPTRVRFRLFVRARTELALCVKGHGGKEVQAPFDQVAILVRRVRCERLQPEVADPESLVPPRTVFIDCLHAVSERDHRGVVDLSELVLLLVRQVEGRRLERERARVRMPDGRDGSRDHVAKSQAEADRSRHDLNLDEPESVAVRDPHLLRLVVRLLEHDRLFREP